MTQAKQVFRQSIAPPPDLTVSEWADKFRFLSSEASSEPGRWKTSRAPYQKEILNAVNDPKCERVVVMSSAQVGKTELILNIIGYYVDYDPAPMLCLQPTLDMAQAFSKDRIAPMVRDTPALRAKISDGKSRDSGNTMLHKSFPGGHLTMAGANSPASLASRPIRIVLADEIDRYPPEAGSEGDPLNLAAKRTNNFWNRKKIYVSTPTIKGASRIEKEYENSTQEEYCLACPECGAVQPLKWANIDFKLVGHACAECGIISDQYAWTKKPGVWIAQAEHHNARGFHLNELVSPWRKWSEIIQDFKDAKSDPKTLKVFINTSLGETWEEDGEQVDEDQLYNRREHYPAQVPMKAVMLTAAVDVQDDRLEIGVEGHGEYEENWKIDLIILRGDPSKPDLWRRLDEVLLTKYEHESGNMLSIVSTLIDSGGHYAQEVYKFVKPREVRHVFAIKGKSQPGAPILSRPSKSNLGGVNLYSIGVDTAKEIIMARLKHQEPGAGYIHFPVSEKFDPEYFAQLAAERCVTKYEKGRPRRVWEQVRKRNEAFDLAVYNYAAMLLRNPNFRALTERLEPKPEPALKPVQEIIETHQKIKKPVKTKPRRGGYVNSWR